MDMASELRTIRKGDMVKIVYTARTEDGKVVETTDEEVARKEGIFQDGVRYGKRMAIVGYRYVVRGLDEDLVGKNVGYRGAVSVDPSDAYGERNPELIKLFTITQFPRKPLPGEEVIVNGSLGVVDLVIGRRVRVDFNHPLAGKKLVYEYEVKERIEDPKEKILEILRMYSDQKFDVEIRDRRAVIKLERKDPVKEQISREILEHVNVDAVEFVEEFISRHPQSRSES